MDRVPGLLVGHKGTFLSNEPCIFDPCQEYISFLKGVKQWRTRANRRDTGNTAKLEETRVKLLIKGQELSDTLRQLLNEQKERLEECLLLYQQQMDSTKNILEILKMTVRRLKAEESKLKTEYQRLNRTIVKLTSREGTLKNAVIRLEEERRLAFKTVLEPHWEVPHHFHMIALEHHRGNKQKQLMEIAELFSGHLRIAAIAKQTSLLPHKVFPEFVKFKQRRENHSEDIEAVSTDLVDKTSELGIATERLKELEEFLGIPKVSSCANAGGSGYQDIKKRYFAALSRRSNTKIFGEPLEDRGEFGPDLQNGLEDWVSFIPNEVESLRKLVKEKKRGRDRLDESLRIQSLLESELGTLRLFKVDSAGANSQKDESSTRDRL